MRGKMLQCAHCRRIEAMAKETEARPKGWIDMAKGGEQLDFCSWTCVAEYANAKQRNE